MTSGSARSSSGISASGWVMVTISAKSPRSTSRAASAMSGSSSTTTARLNFDRVCHGHSVQLSETEQQEASQTPLSLERDWHAPCVKSRHRFFRQRKSSCSNKALRTFFVGLISTAMAMGVTAMATSASPAFATSHFAPHRRFGAVSARYRTPLSESGHSMSVVSWKRAGSIIRCPRRAGRWTGRSSARDRPPPADRGRDRACRPAVLRVSSACAERRQPDRSQPTE